MALLTGHTFPIVLRQRNVGAVGLQWDEDLVVGEGESDGRGEWRATRKGEAPLKLTKKTAIQAPSPRNPQGKWEKNGGNSSILEPSLIHPKYQRKRL